MGCVDVSASVSTVEQFAMCGVGVDGVVDSPSVLYGRVQQECVVQGAASTPI